MASFELLLETQKFELIHLTKRTLDTLSVPKVEVNSFCLTERGEIEKNDFWFLCIDQGPNGTYSET
jgi:hypothetical protein